MVGGEHDGEVIAALYGDDVAHLIFADLVDRSCKFFPDNIPDALFPARDAVSV